MESIYLISFCEEGTLLSAYCVPESFLITMSVKERLILFDHVTYLRMRKCSLFKIKMFLSELHFPNCLIVALP